MSNLIGRWHQYFLAHTINQPLGVKVIAMVTVVLVAFFAIPEERFTGDIYEVGDIASRNIKSDRELLVIDEAATIQKRREAHEHAGLLFDHDRSVERSFVIAIEETFQAARRAASAPEGSGEVKELEAMLGRFHLQPEVLAHFQERQFSEALEQRIKQCVGTAYGQGVYLPGSRSHVFDNAFVRDISTGGVQRIVPERPPRTPSEVAAVIDQHCQESAVVMFTMANLSPDITFNERATITRREELSQQVKPVYIVVRQGEMIVREGEIVDAMTRQKLNTLLRVKSPLEHWFSFMATLIMASILILIPWKYFEKARKKIFNSSDRLYIFFTILLGSIALVKLFSIIAAGLSFNLPYVSYDYLIYAVPIAAGAMLVAILLDLHIAMIYTTVFSIICGVMVGHDISFALYTFVSGLVAAYSSFSFRNRMDLTFAALWSSAAGALVMVSILLFNGDLFSWGALWAFAFVFISGQISMLLVMGLLPIFESGFHVTSDLRLLELSNMGHPLLKQLILRAPGTYHHSIIVGSLVEAAAEEIGVNPLLARVGAYYHDIGKMKKPEYFIENQRGINRHDTLSPAMSSLVITNHVKHGMELAEEYSLPKSIREIIQQHHGRTLIQYFYKKALEGGEKVDDEKFRYAGPKPQTRAAALVMLGDSCEAATRALSEPSHTRIQNLVQKIINNIFVDGQLDECELTLKDIGMIAASFTKTLTGIYHQRIEYPEDKKEVQVPKEKPEKAPDAELDTRSRPGSGNPPIPTKKVPASIRHFTHQDVDIPGTPEADAKDKGEKNGSNPQYF
ncbi:HDIG domain-containing protein [Desulfurispirillum indicum]|uniref:Metal dependent phosphohydrolase n=1 Tax=Desulfurispirillum indicum (strain ATCC BAA-1389 / DSM 22839 / S5) TaxID=653733 RepID=E6W1K2_DESIS|nr:HDIG domain-containing metalloprotein [Desulfurispirillum indicum]ADU66551.1 metal dependent phosphohydrolase [Desulfurispirillum indicum S5]UCZ55872.1 HDIG domain-containing protein [Desulfurispirillum indicum]